MKKPSLFSQRFLTEAHSAITQSRTGGGRLNPAWLLSLVSKPSNLLFVLFLIMGTFSTETVHAQPDQGGLCEETDFPFVGLPEITLCDDFGDLAFTAFIGEGTLTTQSSQIGTGAVLTGNIHIIGDFTVDA